MAPQNVTTLAADAHCASFVCAAQMHKRPRAPPCAVSRSSSHPSGRTASCHMFSAVLRQVELNAVECARPHAHRLAGACGRGTSWANTQRVIICTALPHLWPVPAQAAAPSFRCAAYKRHSTARHWWQCIHAQGRHETSACCANCSHRRPKLAHVTSPPQLPLYGNASCCRAPTVGQGHVPSNRHAALEPHRSLDCQAGALDEGGHRGRQRLELVHQPAGYQE